MAWWNVITDLFTGGKAVAEVFVENRENRGQRIHDEQMADIERDRASLEQFSAEFHNRLRRTWWDSLVDGLNRLPRPLLTIAVLSFFVLAPINPERFLLIAKSFEIMPPGYWALLSVIISFYFGGRMQLKSQDLKIRKDAVDAAKELISLRREFRQLTDEDESIESKIFDTALLRGDTQVSNRVVEQWLESREKRLLGDDASVG
ncbi:Methionine synthase I, cobalamin-binding domain [Marinobacterium lacunae]|uniref:Methionine synthase I, cobalamin-binding domain n=1 Tax=Marinobacterium lacunae TaxID=1232683 RepID=A0A081FVW2_9GAMM|nr:3TM-type holin [Marinobacterium lacunae]KEA62667.1 Methionine synthase I, cobalamin-binding domain [Marinobacterium lacunae]